MEFNDHTRLGEVAAAFPPSMRVFEAHGLDYCCGGQRELGEACSAAGFAPEKVLAEIQLLRSSNVEPVQDWSEASLTELVEHLIATHHVFTRTELVRLAPLMDKVVAVHGAQHPELNIIRTFFIEMAEDLDPHLQKEEQVLFPYLLALDTGDASPSCFGTVANPIHMMQTEHDQIGELLHRIRDLSMDFSLPEDACGSYQSLFMGLADLEADLHQHIHLENNVLFPKGLVMERVQAGDGRTS